MKRYINTSTLLSIRSASNAEKHSDQSDGSSRYVPMSAKKCGDLRLDRRHLRPANIAKMSSDRSIDYPSDFAPIYVSPQRRRLAEKSHEELYLRLGRRKASFGITYRLVISSGQNNASNAVPAEESKGLTITTTSLCASDGSVAPVMFVGTKQNPSTPQFKSSYNPYCFEKYTGKKAELLND